MLTVCSVRVAKGFSEETADLLSFHDIQKDGVDPKHWKEQQCKIRWHFSGKVEMVGLRKIKAIGEDKIGKGKRKKHKTDKLSPSTPLKSQTRKKTKTTNRNIQHTLPWVNTTSCRDFGDAPVTQQNEKDHEENTTSSLSHSDLDTQVSVNSFRDNFINRYNPENKEEETV